MKQNLIALCYFAFTLTVLNITGNAQQTKNTMISTKTTPTNFLPAVGTNKPTEFDDLINRYFDSLNETDGKSRRELVEKVWAENGKFVSPVGEAQGHMAIDAQIQGFQKQFPGALVRRTSDVDVISKNIRFAFEAVQPGGAIFIGGIDFGTVENGKLQSMTGFFDFAPNQENKLQIHNTAGRMTQKNLDATKIIYQEFNQGNFSKVLEMFAPTIEWIAAENSPLNDHSPYRGLNEVRDKVFARLAAGLPGLKINPNELFEAGNDKVIMLGYYDGVFKATGKPIHAQVVHIWTFSDGKAIKFQQYADTYQLVNSAKQSAK